MMHGGRIDAAARAWKCSPEDVLDLSTGVYPEPDAAALAEMLRELARAVGNYPDPDGEPARSALAETLAVPRESLIVAAGAQAFIETVFNANDWSSVALREPCYGEVRRCAERSGVEVRTASGGPGWPQAAVTWVTSPDSIRGAEHELPDVVTGVLDESYADLLTRQRTPLLPGWIRIGSLTKSFSLPGLRLGYAIASPPLVERLRHHLPPWPASTLVLRLLPRLLPTWSARDRAAASGRDRLRTHLESCGWQTAASRASFVLARPVRAAPDFDRRRILVRTFPEWPSLAGWVRIGIPPDEDGWCRLAHAVRPEPTE